MASIIWPSSLPQRPSPQGFSETPGRPIVRTEMDAGPPKMRRRHTAGVRRYSMSFDVTKIQVATFDTFYVTTTAYGSLAFDMINPRTDATEEFRFADEPEYANLGGDHWVVTIQVEQVP